jgi:pimeloyl-ACP methyl ester carboxylesterase
MILIDRQSVCNYRKVTRDVSTFKAHRRTVPADGGTIAYTEFGDAGAPVALFVHGLATGGLMWRNVMEQLSPASRCIAIDLPAHGGTPARADMSVAAMAEVLEELCRGLGIDQVDLVGTDTGGAICQIFAARHPARLRSLTLTNCDTDGNFPPPDFAPMVELARQGKLAEGFAGVNADAASRAAGPLAALYEDPAKVSDEVWREYYGPGSGEQLQRARDVERMMAAFDPADLAAATPGLRTLRVPTLIVWGTGEETTFGLKWAYALRETIPGARDVIEVDGAKLLFAEERPGDLAPHLREFWGR